MSLSFKQIISIAIAIFLIGFSIAPKANTQPSVILAQPPEPPKNPPPDGERTPGGDLGDPEMCSAVSDRPLAAIVPKSSEENTATSAEPVLWVYVPYSSSEVTSGELRLLDREQTKYIREENSLTLPQTPGFVSINLRQTSDEALIENEYYRWYVTMNCQPKSDSQTEPKEDINGWVRLVPDTSGTGASGWYDRLNDVATRLMETPEDRELQRKWKELLESIGLGDLAGEPIIGPVQIDGGD